MLKPGKESPFAIGRYRNITSRIDESSINGSCSIAMSLKDSELPEDISTTWESPIVSTVSVEPFQIYIAVWVPARVPGRT